MSGLAFHNPKVQRLRRLLGRRSARADEGVYVVEGPHLVEEARRAGARIEAIYAEGPYDAAGIPVHELDRGVIGRVATTKHPQPVLAVVRRPLEDPTVLDRARVVVVLERLNDPGNLGTILRSAEAAGIDAVVVGDGSVDPYNPKVVRAAAGALFHVPVLSVDWRDHGLHTFGTSSHRGTPYTEASFAGRVAFVFGSEAHGLDADATVDEWLRIPHAGRAESLNVAMAATLVCFEWARRNDFGRAPANE